MTCEAEEQALADISKQKLNAERHLQHEKAKAESALLRSHASMCDWGAVRLATKSMRCWSRRFAYAEAMLARCKERRKKRQQTTE